MKKIVFIFLLFLSAAALTSCEGFENCKICRLNIYENGILINSMQEAEYCGAELITIENTPPETDGAFTTKWECD